MCFIVWQLIAQAVLLPPPFSPSFYCFYSVTGACSSYCVWAHGWVAKICQPWEQSSSRSWLPIVEAPGCFRHPTSILAMQLLSNEYQRQRHNSEIKLCRSKSFSDLKSILTHNIIFMHYFYTYTLCIQDFKRGNCHFTKAKCS